MLKVFQFGIAAYLTAISPEFQAMGPLVLKKAPRIGSELTTLGIELLRRYNNKTGEKEKSVGSDKPGNSD